MAVASSIVTTSVPVRERSTMLVIKIRMPSFLAEPGGFINFWAVEGFGG